MNRTRRTLLLVLLIGNFPCFVAAETQPIITTNTVMTAEELRATGVGNLSLLQRAALDRWISDYTLTVFTFAKGDKKPLSPATETARAYNGGNTGHWISSTIEHGAIIILEDGSMWAINSLDGSIRRSGFRLAI